MVLSDLEKGILARFFEDYLEVRADELATRKVLEKFDTIADVLKLSEDDRTRLKYIAFHFARLIRHKIYDCAIGRSIPFFRTVNFHINCEYYGGFYFTIHRCAFLEAYRFWASKGGRVPQF